jgi:hypothetical protein
MSLGYVLKQYQLKRVMYSKVLDIRNIKRKLILFLYTGLGKVE